MAKDNRITLYDLQLASGATISPFVWATRYALAHKGFEVELVPGGFTGIAERTGGQTERLPDGRVIACAGDGATAPPRCIVSADFDAVRVARPDGTVVAEWSSG